MGSETAPPVHEVTARDVTRLLLACGEGDRAAFDRLIPLVYAELHEIARRQLGPGDTMGTTGLVHEAYIRLVDQERASWADRNHFYSIAARVMRQVLIDHARRRQAQKRGGGAVPDTMDEEKMGANGAARPDLAWLLDLHAALERLEELDPRLPRVVECLFFAGYTQAETAEALGVSEVTVWRDWRRARGWLYAKLGEAPVASAVRMSEHASR